MPWGKRTKENFHIGTARRVLDEDHYGLQDVKDTILQVSWLVGWLLGWLLGW
jgi:Lon-like ATP-dependent protease